MAFAGLTSPAQLVELFQANIGPRYRITGDLELLGAKEDELRGGRRDDERRAADIAAALADDGVAALLSVRGGAWFTRVLPRIDFSVLHRRTTRVAVFGFSELTTLVNIVGAHPQGLGVYDMGPAFLAYGLKRHARLAGLIDPADDAAADRWAAERFPAEFRAFLDDMVGMIEGRGTRRPIFARLIRGSLPDVVEASFAGGNLVVWATLAASAYEPLVCPPRSWLFLEEINEKPERIDRFLSLLTLAGYWERCAGLLLGDFHMKDADLAPAVVEMLEFHLPRGGTLPVLLTAQVGHIHPMSPLPIRVPARVQRESGDRYAISWDPASLRVVH